MYDKIKVGNSFYTPKALARRFGAHFTCGIRSRGTNWLYFDDLGETVREFASMDLLKQCFQGRWFFAIFELTNENACIKEVGKERKLNIKFCQKIVKKFQPIAKLLQMQLLVKEQSQYVNKKNVTKIKNQSFFSKTIL